MDVETTDQIRYKGRDVEEDTVIRAVPANLAQRWINNGLARSARKRKETTENEPDRETTEDKEKTEEFERPTMQNTKDEIRDYCDKKEVDHNKSDTKKELLQKIESQE